MKRAVRVLLALSIPAAMVAREPLAHAADDSYALSWQVPTAKKGERATARVHLAPGKGYHVNKDFPTALTLVAPAGVVLERPKQTSKDAAKLEEAGADFDVALTASAPAAAVVTGQMRFAVCTATTCDPKSVAVNFTVDVK